MKIKHFEAATEKEAMLKVKEELGKEALIVNIKNIKPKGIFKVFRKPCVKITAAIDEKNIFVAKNENVKDIDRKENTGFNSYNTNQTTKSLETIEEKIGKIEQIINNQLVNENENSKSKIKSKQNNNIINLLYEQLTENEVSEKVANKLMFGLNELLSEGKVQINNLISVIYKRIIDELGNIDTITLEKGDNPKIILFMGPTGVGKTTTIAKIASHFTINKNSDVALITADTYRIAAVDQLRTYANILNIPVEVVYTNDEIESAIDCFKHKNLILIDTAGRSHKNTDQQEDLKELLDKIPGKEIYLVLSSTTKYKDLLKITENYSHFSDYKIIFTKLDESTSYGNILNLKNETGANLSYITFGQNVPDDISKINPHDIAKRILGGQEY